MKIQNELYHYGVKGTHWGVRNGPPYPLYRKTSYYQKTGKRPPNYMGEKTRSIGAMPNQMSRSDILAKKQYARQNSLATRYRDSMNAAIKNHWKNYNPPGKKAVMGASLVGAGIGIGATAGVVRKGTKIARSNINKYYPKSVGQLYSKVGTPIRAIKDKVKTNLAKGSTKVALVSAAALAGGAAAYGIAQKVKAKRKAQQMQQIRNTKKRRT